MIRYLLGLRRARTSATHWPTNGHSRGADVESLDTKEVLRRKRIKWVAAFVVFQQTIVVLVFLMVVTRVWTPKFRIRESVAVRSLSTGYRPSPSFNVTFEAPIRIKNNNLGPYRYESTFVNFTFEGVLVGQAIVPKSKAGFMGTKKLDVNVTVSSSALVDPPGLSTELDSPVPTLNGQESWRGRRRSCSSSTRRRQPP